jgi:hypothetical protein
MAKKIVEYEINDDGNCSKCKSGHPLENIEYTACYAFDKVVANGHSCQACKDFLAQEASKVYCSDCIHLGDYPDWGCDKGQDLNNSLNCKSKRQV